MTRHTLSGRALATLWRSMLVVAVASKVAAAQSDGEQSAYLAMIYTTVGGLPPLPPIADSLGMRKAGLILHGRFGHLQRNNGPSLRSVGLGVEFPVGRVNLGGTLGYLSASCPGGGDGDVECAGDITVGGTARMTLASRPLGTQPSAPKGKKSAKAVDENSWLIGLDASAGYSPRQGEQAFAIAGGLPTALVLKRGDLRILPFITPGLGYGRHSNISFWEDEPPTAQGAIAFMLGGGLGLEFGKSGMGASLGFQRVFKSEGGGTQLGFGMTWNGTTTR